MKVINAVVPRWLQIGLIAAILAVLVWQLAPDNFFYPSAGIALLLVIILAFFIFRSSAAAGSRTAALTPENLPADEAVQGAPQAAVDTAGPGNPDVSPAAGAALTETSPWTANVLPYRYGRPRVDQSGKPDGVEVAVRYYRMAEIIAQNGELQSSDVVWTSPEANGNSEKADGASGAEPAAPEDASGNAAGSDNREPQTTILPMPIINEETTLTEEEKSNLENAVWYTCENPFCKYSHFLDVHHIVDENKGGTNRLDNLIVLCPYCHDLAHRNEIPEEELREWIAHREERFKFSLQWPYV